MYEFNSTNPLEIIQHLELGLIEQAQRRFPNAAPLWFFLSEQFTPERILNVFVPMVGAFNHQLLVRLVSSLGVINALTSTVKWVMPAFRPYWFMREHNESINLQQFNLSCETSGGFPSSHSISFTTYAFLTAVFLLPNFFRNMRIAARLLRFAIRVIVVLASAAMAMSRIYLATQFPHQCVLSSIASLVMLHLFDVHSETLYTMPKKPAVGLVICLGSLPVTLYFVKLHYDIDPHWPVRMAFKWCEDPTHLRHETSPIFTLSRDFGHLMGVALSSPIYKKYETKAAPLRRVPLLFALGLLNNFARRETPKQHGRFVFVAYEFLRNVAHVLTLLNVVPKIS